MITRFGNANSVINNFGSKRSELEGEISETACPGTRDQVAPPTDKDTIEALRAENEHLRQCLYHRATFAQERDYRRYQSFVQGVSTSSIAKTINDLSTVFITHKGRPKPTKLPVQFIYRLTYEIVEQVATKQECRWEDKPNGLSKLKWLWRNNLLFLMPFAVMAIQAVFSTMGSVDPQNTERLFKSLEQHLSGKSTKKKP